MNNTFQQYLNCCSFSYQKIKDAEFEAKFHNHVVKWKGRVKNIGPAELDIILDHTKTLEDSPDMMLRLLQKRIQKSSDKIQLGGDLTFRAQLISYRLLQFDIHKYSVILFFYRSSKCSGEGY